MTDAFVLGITTTHFKRWPDRDLSSLAEEAIAGSLADADISGTDIQSIWFGNCAMQYQGQSNIRGQVCLAPLFEDGTLNKRTPVLNVEGGCATGVMALYGAYTSVLSGQTDVVLAIGADKVFLPHSPADMLALFDGALDQTRKESWMSFYASAAADLEEEFRPHPGRITLLDVVALQIAAHMKRYGTTAEHLAASASKNHAHGARNPKAQYQKPMTTEEVLADKPVIGPLTRSMCAPISDGAAAAVVCSSDFLQSLPEAAQKRAVPIRSIALAGGGYGALSEPPPSKDAAANAFSLASLQHQDIDIVELHDATSFGEIAHLEAMGFCEPGSGGPWVAQGETAHTGALPVNLSGGLVSKGHPLAASGIAMAHELCSQLRGEADERQLETARTGLLHNAGGLVGFDEAMTGVAILGGS